MQDSNDTTTQAAALVWDWRDREAAKDSTERLAVAHARKRGTIGLFVGLGAAAAMVWLLHRPLVGSVVAGLSLVLALLAFVFPRTLYRRVMRGLDQFAHGVGMVVTWALMTVLFYVLFLPVGLVLRAGHKLGIVRHYDPKASTYWKKPRERPVTIDSYRRQF